MQNIMSERTRKKLKLSLPIHDQLHRKTERDCLLFVVVDDDDDVVIAFNCWWGDLFFIEPRGFYAPSEGKSYQTNALQPGHFCSIA